MAKNIFLIILVFFLLAIIYQIFFNNPPTDTIAVKIKDSIYNLEVAKTIPQKTKGLMNRTGLPDKSGMIFISDFEMPQAFWMKNTLIPLDMIFVKNDGTVTNIITAIPQPNTPDNQLKLYQSTSATKYVIELNAGEANRIGLVAGDIIKL